MKLVDLGYNIEFEKFARDENLVDFTIGRVVAEHKERYVIVSAEAEWDAEITGNMRFTAQNREDFPAVGDWVAFIAYDSDLAIIHKILPRFSIIKRQAVGQFGQMQIIAVNIDYAFLMQAVDRDFNLNRLERYLAICYSASVKPIIVLNKTDLITEQQLTLMVENIKKRINNIQIIAISNETRLGYETIKSCIITGKTYCILGSSGVGKTTLINNLSGKTSLKTNTLSSITNKGRHTTTQRELIVLESGGILIDNPGMREVGIVASTDGLETTFDKITKIAQNCKFKNCLHINEVGCAVIEAIEKGEIDMAAFKNYMKMEREKNHFETTVAQKRQKDKKFGKMLKEYNKKFKKK